MIVYEGPSLLNGAPIVAIATGLARRSVNPKTGQMVQVWILPRDESPVSAIRSGADAAVCGDCPLRPVENNVCYVVVHHAPQAVWRRYRGGNYPAWEKRAFAGRRVRLGAYGEPTAVPYDVWRAALEVADGWTGYTHQHRHLPADPWAKLLMASCDSENDAAEASAAGWRTFRVRAEGAPKMPGEMTCPASAEAGHRLTCSSCLACGSKMRRGVVINAHGTHGKAKRFANMTGAA